jgi:hypothetical protein
MCRICEKYNYRGHSKFYHLLSDAMRYKRYSIEFAQATLYGEYKADFSIHTVTKAIARAKFFLNT